MILLSVLALELSRFSILSIKRNIYYLKVFYTTNRFYFVRFQVLFCKISFQNVLIFPATFFKTLRTITITPININLMLINNECLAKEKINIYWKMKNALIFNCFHYIYLSSNLKLPNIIITFLKSIHGNVYIERIKIKNWK